MDRYSHQHRIPVSSGPACAQAGVRVHLLDVEWPALYGPCLSCAVDACRVMLVGLGGNNGTTVTAGILANKQ